MSGGKSKQSSSSQQSSFGESFVAPFQQPFLQDLFRQGAGIATQQLGQIPGIAGPLGQQLSGAGQGFLGALEGASTQTAPGVGDAISGLLSFASGGAPFAGIGQAAEGLLGESPALGGQIDALQSAIQQNLAATAGTIGGQATLQGSTGGSRQALATGLAGQEAQRQFAGGAAGLIGQDFAQRQQLAPQILQTQLQAAQAGSQQQLGALGTAGQLGLSQQAGQAGAAQSGLGQLGGLFNLGLAPQNAQFAPLQQLAQILGPAITLSRQESSGTSAGSGSSFSFGF